MASPESNKGKSGNPDRCWIAQQNAEIDDILYPDLQVGNVVDETRRDVRDTSRSRQSEDYNPYSPDDRSNSLDDY